MLLKNQIFWDIIPVEWYVVADVSNDRYVTLKMKSLLSFWTSVTIYQWTRHNIPNDLMVNTGAIQADVTYDLPSPKLLMIMGPSGDFRCCIHNMSTFCWLVSKCSVVFWGALVNVRLNKAYVRWLHSSEFCLFSQHSQSCKILLVSTDERNSYR